MPRSRSSRRLPTLAQSLEPDYFDSLQALKEWSSRPRLHQSNRNQVPLDLRDKVKGDAGRLVVCHDYKGGYTEDDPERGYTFNFWHLCDAYIYFSHHRVSLPPPAVIRTAHRHGTRILGTLIFEWDAGREDIIELVVPGGKQETVKFDKLDFKYADWLVDLAVERGFDGWLVNIEVDLGGRKEPSGDRKGAKEHAQLLLNWLSYFKAEMHRRITGSEVMWYDAVTLEGKLRWQNTFNSHNIDFLFACDSIFINYFWHPDKLTPMLMWLDQFPSLKENQIYFGIDVYGRGSYGGGGFQTWRAIEEVVKLKDPETGAGLSVALFAPGWTVESEHLKHSLATKEEYARWFDDEMYLWSNGPETPSVPAELARMRKLYQDEAGARRARQLAERLRRNPRIPLSFRAPIEPRDFDLKSVTGPSPVHRSISSFPTTPRAPPTLNEIYYTNFSSGTGHSFHIEGREVENSGTGFTDVDYTFPFPSLIFRKPTKGVKVSFTEELGQVWEGERSIKVEVDSNSFSEKIEFDVLAIDFPILEDDRLFHIKVVYKLLDYRGDPDDHLVAPEPRLYFPDPSEPTGERQFQHEMAVSGIPEDVDAWGHTIIVFKGNEAARISRLSLEQWHPSSFIIGSISLYPAPIFNGPRLEIYNLLYADSIASLEWTPRLQFSPRVPIPYDLDYDESVMYRDSHNVLAFVQYHIYRRRQPEDGGGDDHKETKEWLGTTRERKFGVSKDVISGCEVVVRGVEASGDTVECCALIV